jgi:Cupredoxin-like domain
MSNRISWVEVPGVLPSVHQATEPNTEVRYERISKSGERQMKRASPTVMLLLCLALPSTARAQQSASISVRVMNHRFQPQEVTALANVPITLRVQNLDATPMEFESVSLRVEKVVVGKGEAIIRIRPLSPGRYNFFDDFHQETTGVLVVR